jgi:glyoxylase-like metal-dependent hydrolase (beta-lactamase superfamily II)
MTNRNATASAVMASWLLGCVIASGQSPSGPFDIEVQKVAEGVFVASRPDPIRSPVSGNVTFIVTEKDVIVVDATIAPMAARRVIAEIKKITDKPVRYLVNTHGHNDHTFGNHEFVEAFPGIEILSRPETKDYVLGHLDLPTSIIDSVEERKEAITREIERLDKEERPGKEVVIRSLEQYRSDLNLMADEYRKVEVVAPTMVFESRLVLLRQEKTIDIRWLGFGKTASDVIVYLSEDRVLVSGDIVTHPIPYGFSRQPVQWLDTLEKLAELEFDILIPGHGDVLEGKVYLNQVIDLVSYVIERVQDGIAFEMDREVLTKSILLDDQRYIFTQGDPLLEYRFQQWFVEPHLERTYDVFTTGAEK